MRCISALSPKKVRGRRLRRLEYLKNTGITVIELMPIATFPGIMAGAMTGSDLFAPVAIYGTPDDLRRFVDQAHALGIGVILDVVYNHLGPTAIT